MANESNQTVRASSSHSNHVKPSEHLAWNWLSLLVALIGIGSIFWHGKHSPETQFTNILESSPDHRTPSSEADVSQPKADR